MSHSIEEIRKAFQRVHHVATGQSVRAYMSIPADPARDADLIVCAAIDELEELRLNVDRLSDEFDLIGNVVCGMAIDVERQKAWESERSACAFCGHVDLRIGSVMQEHAKQCSKHPLGAALARVKELEELVPKPDQMVINTADYERLVASIPVGPRIVR